MTNEQLDAIITEFSRALDQRGPECMAQVSPRDLAVALAHFEGIKRTGDRAAWQDQERTG